MKLSNGYIKLIFGLKLRQWRQIKGLSLSELAKKSGLSVSYLTEIESGKKYPKADKISALSEALDITYDKLVSLKLTKQLAPVGELLESNLLKILPLDHYGIDVHKLISSLTDAPTQLSALVSTIIETARESESAQNAFSRTALQTYKALNENYFPELENAVKKFSRKFKIETTPRVDYKLLSRILIKNYNYQIDETEIGKFPSLRTLRGAVFEGKKRTLALNPRLTEGQKAFVVGRELAYNYLNINERSFVHSSTSVATFDELLNNFHASYFANALLINDELLEEDLRSFFALETWQPKFLLDLIDKYGVTPEMFFQRTTNLLSKRFGLNKFFFLRFNKKVDVPAYSLSKELRLNISKNPGGYVTGEHYCRRWVSIKLLEKMEKKIARSPKFFGYLADSLRSHFINSNDRFFNISVAKRRVLAPEEIYSVTIGFYCDAEMKKTIKFWNDPRISFRDVNDTCEMCDLQRCKERAAPPLSLRKARNAEKLKESLEELRKRFT